MCLSPPQSPTVFKTIHHRPTLSIQTVLLFVATFGRVIYLTKRPFFNKSSSLTLTRQPSLKLHPPVIAMCTHAFKKLHRRPSLSIPTVLLFVVTFERVVHLRKRPLFNLKFKCNTHSPTLTKGTPTRNRGAHTCLHSTCSPAMLTKVA
jgi:hypothetical protein